MKRHLVAAVMASVALLSACGDDAEDPGDAASEATEEVGESAEESPADEESPTDEASPTDEGNGGETGSTVLIGMVGTEEDPDAFEISLTTQDGEPVETLPAGDYTIQVDDPSEIHNFHLTGGSVDESTSVPETVETTFEVMLEPGEYTYTCDPHPPMTGTFTVS